MGRLTLNVLLSFAQFEREVIGERIRDKIAASKKKGMWMGGVPPLGYQAQDRKLVIVESEAEIVRFIFQMQYGTASCWSRPAVSTQPFCMVWCWPDRESPPRCDLKTPCR